MSVATAPLVRYSGTPAARVATWADLPADALKRRVMAAARDRDVDALCELTETYLTLNGAKGARVSRHTIAAYRRSIHVLIADWAGQTLLHPALNSGSLWLRDLEWRGAAPSTVAVRLAGARALYAALRWADATKDDPFPLKTVRAGVDPTPPWERQDAYTQEEVDRLLAAAEPLDRLFILLCAHGGLRISEALSREWTDFDTAAHTLVVVGKGGKRRTVTVSDTLHTALLASSRSGVRIFPYSDPSHARRRFRRVCDAAGVKYRGGVHALRHSCGTRIYHELGDLNAVATHLGHSSLETARIYAKRADTAVQTAVAAW